MPSEFSRTTARKTVKLPSGDEVSIPVITKISFIDASDRHQESEHSLDNSIQSNRIVHTDPVHRVPVDQNGIPLSDPPTQDISSSLYVERIETWNAIDASDRFQETQLSVDNITGNDALPPHFSTHKRTHIYRYYQDPQNPNDGGPWIDSELIDEFSVIDPSDRYQETQYTLNNSTNSDFRNGDLSGQADPASPDITIGGIGEGTQENPVRIDPFQNIVNWNGGLVFLISQSFGVWGDSAGPFECSPGGPPIDPLLVIQYQVNFNLTGGTWPPMTGPGGPISPSDFSVPGPWTFGAWEVGSIGTTPTTPAGYPTITLTPGAPVTLPPAYAYLGGGWTSTTFSFAIQFAEKTGGPVCVSSAIPGGAALAMATALTGNITDSITIGSTFTYQSLTYAATAVKIGDPIFGQPQSCLVLFLPI